MSTCPKCQKPYVSTQIGAMLLTASWVIHCDCGPLVYVRSSKCCAPYVEVGEHDELSIRFVHMPDVVNEAELVLEVGR